MSRSNWTTIEEHQKALEADSEFVAAREERERERLERAERFLNEQKPIMADLRAVGMTEDNIGEIVMRRVPYPQAIPVLLEHMRKPYSDVIKESLARCLAVPDARYAWPIFKEEYLKAPVVIGLASSYRDGLACALNATATEAVFDEVAEIMRDRSQGKTRVFLLRFLKKSKNPAAKELLDELASDPDLAPEIKSWKKKK